MPSLDFYLDLRYNLVSFLNDVGFVIFVLYFHLRDINPPKEYPKEEKTERNGGIKPLEEGDEGKGKKEDAGNRAITHACLRGDSLTRSPGKASATDVMLPRRAP